MTVLQSQVADLRREGLEPAEIARRLGKSRQYVWCTIKRIEGGEWDARSGVPLGMWTGREVKAEPHCVRCGLRGSHVCLDGMLRG